MKKLFLRCLYLFSLIAGVSYLLKLNKNKDSVDGIKEDATTKSLEKMDKAFSVFGIVIDILCLVGTFFSSDEDDLD